MWQRTRWGSPEAEGIPQSTANSNPVTAHSRSVHLWKIPTVSIYPNILRLFQFFELFSSSLLSDFVFFFFFFFFYLFKVSADDKKNQQLQKELLFEYENGFETVSIGEYCINWNYFIVYSWEIYIYTSTLITFKITRMNKLQLRYSIRVIWLSR